MNMMTGNVACLFVCHTPLILIPSHGMGSFLVM